MKDIILDPVFLVFILAIGLIYIGVAFHLTSRNPKLAAKLETLLIVLFILTFSRLELELFERLSPESLAEHGKTMPAIAAQLGLYAAILFILLPRLRHTLKDFLHILSIILTQDPFLCLLMLMVGLSAIWSQTPIETFKMSLVLLSTTTICVYIAKQYNWQNLDNFFRGSGALVALLSLIIRNPIGKGWSGVLGHPNQLGSSMALVATLWIWYIINHGKQRWLALVIVGISLLLLYKTNSAGAKVQLVVLLSFLIYLRFIKSLSSQWAFIAVVLFLVIVTIATILVTENLETIVVDTLGKDLTFTGRTPLWQLLWERKIKSHFWLGYGYESFWQPWRGIDNPANDVVFANGWRATHAHNGFVELFLALGVIGFVLFAFSFLTTIARSVLYMSQSKEVESVLPLVFLIFLLIPNLSLSRLLEFGDIWCYYIFVVVRLNLDTQGKPQGGRTERSYQL